MFVDAPTIVGRAAARISYLTVSSAAAEAFAPVVSRLAGT
jgi:hypothetical protein